MEYLTQGEFWQEVGLAVAARLSVVAVALWAVKMTLDYLHASSAVRQEGRQAVVAKSPDLAGSLQWQESQRLKALFPFEERHRPLALKKPGPTSTERLSPWQERLQKYLAGEPAVSAAGARRQTQTVR